MLSAPRVSRAGSLFREKGAEANLVIGLAFPGPVSSFFTLSGLKFYGKGVVFYTRSILEFSLLGFTASLRPGTRTDGVDIAKEPLINSRCRRCEQSEAIQLLIVFKELWIAASQSSSQ